jgi:glycosyltransferase involved in cell wall biosynthesis
MRIGIDTHAAEIETGGNSTYIRGLVRALLALEGDEIWILYALDPRHPFYADLPRNPRLRVRRLWPRTPLLRIPFALAAASVRDRLDVLHVQYVGPPWHRGARVVTVHDLAFLHVPASFDPWQRRRLVWQTHTNVARAAAVITGSEHAKRDIEREYGVPKSRVTAIYHAPDPRFAVRPDPDVIAALRARFDLRHRYVLSVGRMNPRKNLLGVLHAFERVHPQLAEPTRLVIAGPRDYAARDLEAAIAASPYARDVVLTGYLQPEELAALVADAAVFLYPSFYEGFGLPPIEAMAAGVPVVSSGAGALREVLGDAALLVDPADVDDIAYELVRVLGDASLRAALAERGRARVAGFTWENAARRTREVYHRCVRATD